MIDGAMRSGRHRGHKLITTEAEHPAVLEACRRQEQAGAQVVYLKVDEKCRPDMEQHAAELDEETAGGDDKETD